MSQNVTAMQSDARDKALRQWFDSNPWAAMRGIDEPTWNALRTTIYPGCKDESILMAVDYCRARNLDVMLKPVHLVPMQVTNPETQQKEWRDVPMPGVGLYRIQADRSGDYAGADEPEFGPIIEQTFQGKYGPVKMRYPEWCKITIYKLMGDRLVGFTAKEFWTENYATQNKQTDAPNAMWQKRPFGQLAKCTEAQSLRKGWPEIGQEPTAEEMEGKGYERDMGPAKQVDAGGRPEREAYPQEDFEANFPKWQAAIESGKRTAEQIIQMVSSKADLTDEQKQQIRAVEAEGEE